MPSACVWKCCRIFVWIAFEIVDLVLDWDFYAEVVATKQDSIQTAKDLHTAILAFAIFGTVTCVISIVIKIYGVWRGKEDSLVLYLLSLISTWLEDFPQIILAIIVAVKTSELISNVQVIKAGYAIAETVIQIIRLMWLFRIKTLCIRYCCCECINDENEDETSTKACTRGVIICDLTGQCMLLLCAIFLMMELQLDFFK